VYLFVFFLLYDEGQTTTLRGSDVARGPEFVPHQHTNVRITIPKCFDINFQRWARPKKQILDRCTSQAAALSRRNFEVSDSFCIVLTRPKQWRYQRLESKAKALRRLKANSRPTPRTYWYKNYA